MNITRDTTIAITLPISEVVAALRLANPNEFLLNHFGPGTSVSASVGAGILMLTTRTRTQDGPEIGINRVQRDLTKLPPA